MKAKWGCEGETLPGWGILSCGMWVCSWDHVPNPQKPVHLPASMQRFKERTVQKLKCFWCSRHPGRAGDGRAAHAGRGCCRVPHPARTSQPPRPCPTGEIQGRGSPVLVSPLINSHNYQPGQALPLIVALQCFAPQLLNQQEQPPGRAETPVRGEGSGAAGPGETPAGTRGCCIPATWAQTFC